MIYGNVRVRPATAADAASLAPRLRAADLLELESSGIQLSPENALRFAVAASSNAQCVERDGEVIALFGATPDPADPTVGHVWLTSCDALWDIRFTFLKHSAEHLKALFDGFRLLGNFVDSRNVVHVRWLKWLGFRFLRRVPLPSGATFLEFCKLADD